MCKLTKDNSHEMSSCYVGKSKKNISVSFAEFTLEVNNLMQGNIT